MRDGLLFLHILGASAWIGGGLFGMYAYSSAARIGPPARRERSSQPSRSGEALYFGLSSPGGLACPASGLVLTSDAYGWGDTFVLIGLGAFLLSGIVQSTVGRKANERLVEAGNTGSNLPRRYLGLAAGSRCGTLVVLFVVVWVMITKLGA